MKKFIALSLCAITLLASCSKDSDTPTVSRGSLSGTIIAYDDKTSSSSNASGFTVTLLPTGKTATTDAAGKFNFADLAYDSYDLTVSKTGYGTYKLFGVNLQSASQNIPSISMGAVSTTTVTAFTLNNTQYNGGPGVSYIYSTSPAPSSSNRGYTRAFLGTANDVSSSNYVAFSSVRSNQSNSVNGGFTADELYAMGFRTGQPVFIKLYGESAFSNSYLDPATSKTVFPNLNATSPSPITFIVP